MASQIPSTRLGRALKAGIPVFLIILGSEMLTGHWSLDRQGNAVRLNWASSAQPASDSRWPTMRLSTCLGQGCDRWTLAVSLPEHPFGSELVSFARTMVDVVTGRCREPRGGHKTLAMA